jgi:hypothetical protein
MAQLASLSIRLLPGALRVSQAHRLAGQQPDNLCGPYWVAILLQAYDGVAFDAGDVARLANSVLPVGDPGWWLPNGASSRPEYSDALPQTCRMEDAGTAVSGVIEATARASEGRYALVPLRSNWSEKRVKNLLALCEDFPHWQATPICNLQTGFLWAPRLALVDAFAYLKGENIDPKIDWNIGHYLTLAGTVKGLASSFPDDTERMLAIVRDTYPTFGWDGYHLQPAEAIANALSRDDGAEGGVLLFVAAKNKVEIEQEARARGFDIAVWDNGTPWPPRPAPIQRRC